MKEFLIVYESLWNNKFSYRTQLGEIGDTIKEIMEDHDLINDEIDIESYNSDKPYDVGTLGPGFYDISFEDENGEYEGRIMIFFL